MTDNAARRAVHGSPINCLAFSKDDKILAVGTEKGGIKLWNMASGKDLITLPPHDGEVLCVAFSADSRTVASTGWDKTIKLWELPPIVHAYPRLELFIEKK